MSAILLVEDNPITCRLVRFTLEAEHYDVIEAPDGETARKQFREHKPALVLLDLLLPDVDGFALLDELRAQPNGHDVPILAFSGMMSSYDQSRLSEAGFDDVVSKPIEPSRLVQIVRGYVPLGEAPPVATGATARTLVLADDDPVQRKLVALRLRRAGFEVVPCIDGQDALERARELKPYAVVSDVLMPRLDGFGLCMAARNDPQLADTPIILISNSYLEAEDKALAERVGADELLVRTPDLHELLAVLDAPPKPKRRRPASISIEPELGHERIRRMMSQLERQGALHATLAQRCSLLSAELSVLSGISEAVATQDDLEGALHQILASCFDAGGISLGMLYIATRDGMRGVHFGPVEGWTDADIASFFGHRELLEAAIRDQALVCVPSPAAPAAEYAALLEATTARSLMIAPLGHRGQSLGALVTMSRSLDVQTADSIAFAQAVAGQISLALALARSFQAKDESERSARGNATVLRSILDSMAEGVIVSDDRGDVTHWNHAATSILRLSPDQLRRDALDAGFPLARARAGEAVDRAEVRLQREGEDRWLSVNARPLADDPSGVRGGVAVFRDVTDERAAHARMLVTERMASLGTLAAGVGHEINNPLMAVLGNLDMAISDLRRVRGRHPDLEDLDELTDELSDAREAAERVRNIVRDLKLFSRSDEESRGEVRVEHALESSIRMVWNEVRHRATLVRDYKPVPPVYANESRLGQVFLNLIVNAAQAIPEGRASQHQIRVATSVTADDRVRIDIADTGSGMAPDVVAQLFTPFFTTKPIGVGTGLGLSICHQLVTAVGGDITVDTKVGAGTTFSVFLPAAAPAARVAAPTTPAVAPSTRRGRILIVDDEQMVAATLKRALGKRHDVAIADAAEAARLVDGGREFDVILCDLMMPNITGMDLHAEIDRMSPAQAARMIFVTGGAFTEQGRTFLERTKNVHLEKPVDVDELRALVDAAVARSGELVS
ncbi:MAG TPA: response regulator [Kofleriaceae bacterium]|jgi:PAS domain S-box-containing protein